MSGQQAAADAVRHIVAMGGGGFSSGDAESHRLDDYVLDLTGEGSPRVCFVATASGDADSYIVRFYEAFPADRCRPSHLSLFRRTVIDLRRFILDQDVVYVGGGNTANLLAVWRAHGLDVILREAWTRGVVLCGLSAGALCWFEGGTTDSFGPELAPLKDGLGLLAGSFCPHYDVEPQRRPSYHRYVADGTLPPGIAADNGVGVHFVGNQLSEIVASHAARSAYLVEQRDGTVTETSLLPVHLLA
jgi:dipeptidase E